MGRQKECEVLVAGSVFAVVSAILVFLSISLTKNEAYVKTMLLGKDLLRGCVQGSSLTLP